MFLDFLAIFRNFRPERNELIARCLAICVEFETPRKERTFCSIFKYFVRILEVIARFSAIYVEFETKRE